MKLFHIVWVAVVIALAAVSIFYKTGSTIFYGIAESREIVINSESGVEIKKIHVVQGQLIKLNDLLVELRRPGLDIKINGISHQLTELQAKSALEAGVSQSQIDQLKAEQAARVNEITSEIKRLEAQYELNKKLTSGLKSLENEPVMEKAGSANPILGQIAELKKELNLALSPSRIKIARLKKGLNTSESPIKIKMNRLEKELALLRQEQKELNITSPINGVIGSVNYKEGEKASPFSAILTLHSKSPSYVKGYIHENIYSKVNIGQMVRVASSSGKRYQIHGDIVGVGSRIVEYPSRLRKRQDIKIWGREVIIRIPPKSNFLLGEKVLITPVRKFIPLVESTTESGEQK